MTQERTHPPSLLTRARTTLRDECGVRPGDRLVVAVSGGGDSIALLDCLARLRDELDVVLFAHGVDHGLRAEAPAELRIAEDLARRHGVPYSVTHLAVEPGGNLQARARDARYRALQDQVYQCQAQYLATGHHADDRAETVLLRLLRGAGARGLGVLPARSGERIRPLIRATKEDVLLHLRRHQLGWAEDPSNADPSFARVQVRSVLLPLLKELSPAVVQHLNNLADDLHSSAEGEGNFDGLGRAQREQLLEILRLRRLGGEVRLPDRWVLRLDREQRTPHIKP